jgi:hypothetical protein
MKKVIILLFALLSSGSAFATADEVADKMEKIEKCAHENSARLYRDDKKVSNLGQANEKGAGFGQQFEMLDRFSSNEEICFKDRPNSDKGLSKAQVQAAIYDGMVSAARSVLKGDKEEDNPIVEAWVDARVPRLSKRKHADQLTTTQNSNNVDGAK